MDKGIRLQKELAMGMDSAKKEATGKKKYAEGGKVKKDDYAHGGMCDPAIEKKNMAYGGKAGKKNLKKGGRK
jgi:hypothetical protein